MAQRSILARLALLLLVFCCAFLFDVLPNIPTSPGAWDEKPRRAEPTLISSSSNNQSSAAFAVDAFEAAVRSGIDAEQLLRGLEDRANVLRAELTNGELQKQRAEVTTKGFGASSHVRGTTYAAGDLAVEDGVLTYRPTTLRQMGKKGSTALVLQVAVGAEFIKEITPSIEIMILYCMRHGFGYRLETNSMCKLRATPQIRGLKVGSYFDAICSVGGAAPGDGAVGGAGSSISEWYGPHGWKWSWNKPYALLRAITAASKSSSPHWIHYVDTEAVPVAFEEPQIEALLARAESATGGALADEYALIVPTPTQPGGDYQGRVLGVEKAHADQFALNAQSPAAARFATSWIAHNDCEAFVDQASFWLELLRMSGGAAAATDPPPRSFDEDFMCRRAYSNATRERVLENELRKRSCLDARVRYTKRTCTRTRPGEMLCDPFGFTNCFRRTTRELNISAVSSRPPILYLSEPPLDSQQPETKKSKKTPPSSTGLGVFATKEWRRIRDLSAEARGVVEATVDSAQLGRVRAALAEVSGFAG